MNFDWRNNPVMDIAKTIGENLTALMGDHPSLDTCKKVSARSGVGFGTVQRAKNGDANITVEKLAAIASAFSRHPAELMLERKGANPPAVADYSKTIEGSATRVEANEPNQPTALASVSELPQPLLSELADIAKRINDPGLHRLIGQALQLAEQFPRVNKTNAVS